MRTTVPAGAVAVATDGANDLASDVGSGTVADTASYGVVTGSVAAGGSTRDGPTSHSNAHGVTPADSAGSVVQKEA